MSTTIVNHYKRRQVAQANEKACAICYRPTDIVLMSIDSKDWFYCCAQHLKDPGFAQPIRDDQAEKERLKQIEIAKVKAEYEAKEARKAEIKKEIEKEKEEKEGKDKKSWLSMVNPFSGAPAAPTDATTKTPEVPAMSQPEPKEFALHRTLYQHRCNLKIQAAQEKAKQLQWQSISFPSAPGK